ncbi:MAG: flippase-like domain-containing protein [Acidobacteria bacterium]|nr:flippase-like domain-containing protein [Acidobacteriota bacterium]
MVGAALSGWSRVRELAFDWRLFRETLAGLDWRWLSLGMLLAVATYYGRALRWAVMLEPLRPKPGIWNLFQATVIGFTALVLFGRAGEFVRPYLIARKENVPLTSQLAAWTLERTYDLLFALVIFGFSLSQARQSHLTVGPALRWVFEVGGYVVVVACCLCLALLASFGTLGQSLRNRLLDALGFLHERHLSIIEQYLTAFLQGVESTRSPRSVSLMVGYTLLEWLLIAGCYLSILRAFGNLYFFSLIDILIFMGFVAFGSVVQLPGVGGGVQVVAVLVLREMFGVPLEVATSMAVAIWSITFLVVLPLGLPLALHQGLNWKQLRALRQEVHL